jgi:hypothetical protein
MFRVESNKFLFFGETKEDLRTTSASLYHLITKQGYDDTELDFSQLVKVDQAFILPLFTICRKYRSDRVSFTVKMPNDPKISALFVNCNWMNVIDPEHFDSRDKINKNNLSATIFNDSDSQYDVVNHCLDLLLQNVSSLDRKNLSVLEWALNEVTGNVLDHSESRLGRIVQVSTFPKTKKISFLVCDPGIGIPASLRKGHPEISDDTSALDRAIREGATRNKKTNQGNGLFGTFKCCQESNGEFSIISGRASLFYSTDKFRVKGDKIPVIGTHVKATLSYEDPNLLERAFIFGGRHHEPDQEYIYRRFNFDGERFYVHVKTEITHFHNRAAGLKARQLIENIIKAENKPVELDFDDIAVISSSFADEVFGKMFMSLGAVDFSRLVYFKNISQLNKRIIDKAIAERLLSGDSGL